MSAEMSKLKKEIDHAETAISSRGGFQKFYYTHESKILGTLGVLVLLGLWEMFSRMNFLDVMFTSSPSRIWEAGVKYIASGEVWGDFAISGMELIIGFALAIVVGIPVGIAMGWFRKVNFLMDPLLNFAYASPRIALVPLFIIWFGIGMGSKVAVVFLGAVFPIVINTMVGVKTVDPMLLNVARSFNATDGQIFRTTILPSSVPYIISGMRLGLGHALIGVVVGEMVAGTAGVGYMLHNAGETFQTDLMFVGVFIIAGLGVLLTSCLRALEKRFDKWRTDISK